MNNKINENNLENKGNSATGSAFLQKNENFSLNHEQNQAFEPKKAQKSLENAQGAIKAGENAISTSKNGDYAKNVSKIGEKASSSTEIPVNNVGNAESNETRNKSSESLLDEQKIDESAAKSTEIAYNVDEIEENPNNSINSHEITGNMVLTPCCIGDFFNSDSENELKSQFPSVEVENLRNNKDFADLLELIIQNPSLSQVYSYFNAIISSTEEASKKKLAHALATAESGVGSLSSSAKSEDVFFTKEQVLHMSREEIRRNYTKIRQSQQMW